VNGVPLNGYEDTVIVNYIEYRMEKKGEMTYHNSRVTDIGIDEQNVGELVEIGGRSRTKRSTP